MAGPAIGCVGAFRIEGCLKSNKMDVMNQGWGMVHSSRFEGELAFQAKRSPLLTAPDAGMWKSSDAVIFQVVQGMNGTCEAINTALSHQVVNPNLQRAAAPSIQGTKDPKELVGGGRIEGFVSTPTLEATAAGCGFVTSPSFSGQVMFHIADNPAMSWSKYEKGSRVSFTIGVDQLSEAVGLQMRLSNSTEPIQQPEDDMPASKKHKTMEASVAALVPMNDPHREVPTLLPVTLFAEHDSPETKVGLVQAAFEDLCVSHREQYAAWDISQLVKTFVWEADSLFGTDGITKRALAQRLNRLPYFLQRDVELKFTGPKCRLTVAKKNRDKDKDKDEAKTRLSAPLPVPKDGKEDRPLCWYWKTGECGKGDASCPFRHYFNLEEQLFGEKDDSADLCWFWANGKCDNGVRCQFRHYYTEAEGGLGFEASCIAAAATGAFGGGTAPPTAATVEPEKIQGAAKAAAIAAGPSAVKAAAAAAAAQLGLSGALFTG